MIKFKDVSLTNEDYKSVEIVTTEAYSEQKALMNECIINVMLAHPDISQTIKDEILAQGTMMADRYTPSILPEEDIIDLFSRGTSSKTYLVKQSTDATRINNMTITQARYAEQGNKLTQRYFTKLADLTALSTDNDEALDGTSGIKKLKEDKLVPLMMGVVKGLISRPKTTGFFMNPSCEAIIILCEKSRKVWTTSDIVFKHKGFTYPALSPEVFTTKTWTQKLDSLGPKSKIVVYSICPSADVDEVNIVYRFIECY